MIVKKNKNHLEKPKKFSYIKVYDREKKEDRLTL